ncbi:MAG: hypothetical protein FWC38_01915 [Proteobacteria bacterium]|nr:hypothetical protein [Pseudomonadota bacterium]MCL2306997.1 hypothetical protein [Pseudomonadota bacterium]
MRVISSRLPLLFYKYIVLPLMWLLFIVLFAMFGSIMQDEKGLWLLMATLLLTVAMSAVYLWRVPHIIKPFADKVQDAGDALIVRKSGNQERIPLANIASIEARLLIFPRGNNTYYLITLCAPCSLGSEIAFFPINDGSRFLDGTPWQSRHKSIYDDLAERISQARKIE